MNKVPVFADRRNTGSVKWDMLQYNYGRSDLQPMWIADMDFRVPNCVQEALNTYMQTGVYGYSYLGAEFLEAFVQWEETHHALKVEQNWLRYSPGVVAGLNWAVTVFTEPDDRVMVLSPVYAQFFGAVKQNGRRLVESKLVWQGKSYGMDYKDIEEKIQRESIKMLLICSPHNPVARVWKRDELEQLVQICRKYHVLIVSDEIHQDITMQDACHIPIAKLYPEGSIILTSPSKTFNLAGFYNALAVIPNDDLRKSWDEFTRKIHVTYGNTLGYIAGTAAYRAGEAWNQAVCRQIYSNFVYLRDRLVNNYPMLRVPELEGTYLMWIDFGAYLKKEEIKPFFQEKCGLAPSYGSAFGGDSETCVRLNLATSRELIKACADKILKAMAEWDGSSHTE